MESAGLSGMLRLEQINNASFIARSLINPRLTALAGTIGCPGVSLLQSVMSPERRDVSEM